MEKIKAKLRKAKEWAAFYAPEIITGSVGAIMVSGMTYLVYRRLKTLESEDQKYIEDWNTHAQMMNDWLAEETDKGNAIYVLADGAFMVVPEESPREIVRK